MNLIFWLGWFISKTIAVLFFRVKIMGRENIPKTGPFILASNHVSFYDPPLVGSSSPRLVHFMAKKELFKNPFFGWLITQTNAHPINRRGFDRKAIETTENILKKGQGLTIFPEGTRARSGDFLPPHPGVGMLARKNIVPVVPVYVNGPNRLKDCFWGRDRLSVTFGKVIDTDRISGFSDDKEGYKELARYIMDRIKDIKQEFVERNRKADNTVD